MFTAYSLNQTVAAGAPISFSNTLVKVGCSSVLSAPDSILLREPGTYSVVVNASSAAASSIAITYNGVTLPNTVMTGDSMSPTTLIDVPESTCPCCSQPTTIQVINPAAAEAVYSVVNITVRKEY